MVTEEEWQLIIDQVNEQLGLHLTLDQIQTVYEIVIYAIVIDEGSSDYGYLEITVYTKRRISVADVYQCIESQGFRALRRDSGINRIDVNELKIGSMERQLPPGRELSTDWCDDILKAISVLPFFHKKSGYYYRKRSGISESEYKAQRKARMKARTESVQERLDRYGMEE